MIREWSFQWEDSTYSLALHSFGLIKSKKLYFQSQLVEPTGIDNQYQFNFKGLRAVCSVNKQGRNYTLDLTIDGQAVPLVQEVSFNSLTGKIQRESDAIQTINDVSASFLVFSGLSAVVSILVLSNIFAIFDFVLFAALSLLLRKFKSLIAAIILSLFSLISVVNTILVMAGVVEGGRNIYIALLLFWGSIKALQAVLFLRKQKKQATQAQQL
ncbi:hypothetical protein [Alkaliphilus crotonatoxidans]